MARPRELWGRRSVAVGVTLLAIAVIGAIVLIIVGGGDDGNSDKPVPADRVAQLQDQLLTRTAANPEAGILVRRPAKWALTKRNGAITLRSPGSCVAMSMSAPASARDAKGLHDDALAALKATYGKLNVQSAGRGQVGGIPTRSETVGLTNNGNDLRVLLSVGTGKKNAYLTEVVLSHPSCQADLKVAQLILTSAQFTK
jgi:hypothetical protein